MGEGFGNMGTFMLVALLLHRAVSGILLCILCIVSVGLFLLNLTIKNWHFSTNFICITFLLCQDSLDKEQWLKKGAGAEVHSQWKT